MRMAWHMCLDLWVRQIWDHVAQLNIWHPLQKPVQRLLELCTKVQPRQLIFDKGHNMPFVSQASCCVYPHNLWQFEKKTSGHYLHTSLLLWNTWAKDINHFIVYFDRHMLYLDQHTIGWVKLRTACEWPVVGKWLSIRKQLYLNVTLWHVGSIRKLTI